MLNMWNIVEQTSWPNWNVYELENPLVNILVSCAESGRDHPFGPLELDVANSWCPRMLARNRTLPKLATRSKMSRCQDAKYLDQQKSKTSMVDAERVILRTKHPVYTWWFYVLCTSWTSSKTRHSGSLPWPFQSQEMPLLGPAFFTSQLISWYPDVTQLVPSILMDFEG